ncbi:MAG: bifunctional folylpolyglutamate synthase/dihydrofolate synthase [Oscillospiraceae bacterium]|nr:bifunctional folylpolyglutamate synthase/dihydrofolate synthase [Oscillospiraceae bacterium]
MDYNEAISYIHSFTPARGPKRSLDRTRDLLSRLGSPERKLRYVHITGTNGKGSVAAMTESVLRSAGYKTGLFTSPFLNRFNERIRINGEDIPDEDLARLVSRVRPYIDRLPDVPTEFEVVTVLALTYFAEKDCQIVVLEVGMGGRSDYTNVIPAPETAVFTSVGLDHIKQLGGTVRAIAENKAGIIKLGCEVIAGPLPPEAMEVISSRAEEIGARLSSVRASAARVTKRSLSGVTFDFGGYKGLTVPLAGDHQAFNAAAAILVCRALRRRGFRITPACIRKGLESVSWPGRMELLREKPLFFLDGAHNPQAVAAAASFFRDSGLEPVFLVAAMEDKDIDGILDILTSVGSRFVTLPLEYRRAMDAGALAEKIRSRGAQAFAADSAAQAVSAAADLAGERGCVCALGSLYMSGLVREEVNRL